MSNLQQAFYEICEEAQETSCYYVALFRRVRQYGGPEEGGWWKTHQILEAAQRFELLEAAEVALAAVKQLAKELTEEESKRHGDMCLRQWEEADRRGVDADDWFGPDAGADEYYVVLVEGERPESRFDNSTYC